MNLQKLFCVFTCLSIASSSGYADELKLGRPPVLGQVGKERKPILDNPGAGVWYQKETEISLQAGQSIELKAVVTGKDRRVGIVVVDETNTPVTLPVPKFEPELLELKVEEVNATGTYKIILYSDRIGPFTLQAKDITEKDASIEELEKERQKLLEALEAVERKLKAAKGR